MKSFPSTTLKGGINLNQSNVSSSLKDQVTNAFKSAFTQGISNVTSGRGLDTEGIDVTSQLDRRELYGKYDFTRDASLKSFNSKLSTGSSNIPNDFRFDHSVFSTMNNYMTKISHTMPLLAYPTKDDPTNTLSLRGEYSPSLFNPMYGVMSTSITEGVPLLDNQVSTGDESIDPSLIGDCSIKRLVELSSEEGTKTLLGNARYKYADFMYCKHLGKISNNHLITLRKYALPIEDDINFYDGNINEDQGSSDIQTDIGRLVTWFGTEDNKLEDIMSYEYEATWKEMNATDEQLQSQEENQERGIVGLIANGLNGEHRAGVKTGQWGAPLINALLPRWMAGSPSYQDNPAMNGTHYDANAIYSPKNTIQSTHQYEGNLKFSHTFKLKFSYKLRSYDGINPKSAFLDLIANILAVTYKKGTFWKGNRTIIGPQPSTQQWKKANAILNKAEDGLNSFFGDLLDGNLSLDDLLGTFSEMLGKAIETVKSIASPEGIEGAKNLAKSAVSLGLSGLRNKLGRPSVYAFNSLLSPDPVGLWHVTIGNPLNPIASFGNLILKKSRITHSGPLGIDDFPTELTVEIELQHAKPRDMVGIQRMYTKGQRAIYYAWNRTLKENVPAKIGESQNEHSLPYFGDLGSDRAKRVIMLRNEIQ